MLVNKLISYKLQAKYAFTLIEILVVMVIISLLVSLAIIGLGVTRSKGRDAKRISDIKQIQTALELYYSDNGAYPTALTSGAVLLDPSGAKTYINKMPTNPTPWSEGACITGANYSYATTASAYSLSYCIANNVNEVSAGSCTAVPGNICGSAIAPALVTTVISASTSLTSTTDGAWVVAEYGNLTIDSGKTLTVSNRNKGLILYVNGDLTVNGTITMTARGASAVGNDICIIPANASSTAVATCNGSYVADTADYQSTYHIPAGGASGAPSPGAAHGSCAVLPAAASSNNGTSGANGQSGGGGAGGSLSCNNGYATGGAGAAGTSYSGGSGGGSAYADGGTTVAGAGGANGGAGGNGTAISGNSCGQGGAGNGGGTGGNNGGVYARGCDNGSSGTGGLLIIIVKGGITVGVTGVISSDGSSGGNGQNWPGGGGSSGGGNVTILYKGSYTNSGSVRANGGAQTYCNNSCGGSGGNGSVRSYKIN